MTEAKIADYEDPVLREVRSWKEQGKKHQATESLPPSTVACSRCPKAMWMWVVKTDPAKKNAMPGFEDKAGWRCRCRETNQVTYDEYASGAEPDAWVVGCTARAEALEAYAEDAARAPPPAAE